MSSQSITARQQLLGDRAGTGVSNVVLSNKVQTAMETIEDPSIRNLGKNVSVLATNATVVGREAKQFLKSTVQEVGFLNKLFLFAKSSIGRALLGIVGIILLGRILSGTIGGMSSTMDPNTQFLMKSVSAWSYILCIILVLNFLLSLM